MSFEGMGISLTLIILVVLWVASPLISKRRGKTAVVRDLSLNAAYERALVAIRDLDEDFSTGKIEAEAYQRERELWLQRGIAALQALDAAGQLGAEEVYESEVDEPEDQEVDPVEQALAAYRRSARSTAH
ncbi:MAG: hypothetical protein KF716_13785 [Anaerolineae bacterium]|nr:hypothetical protein [Anaerolineae bacterium]